MSNRRRPRRTKVIPYFINDDRPPQVQVRSAVEGLWRSGQMPGATAAWYQPSLIAELLDIAARRGGFDNLCPHTAAGPFVGGPYNMDPDRRVIACNPCYAGLTSSTPPVGPLAHVIPFPDDICVICDEHSEKFSDFVVTFGTRLVFMNICPACAARYLPGSPQ